MHLKSISLIYLILIFCILLNEHLFASATDTITSRAKINYDLVKKSDATLKKTVFYLLSNGITTDSIKFENQDLLTDSFLNNWNNSWYYCYSECTICLPSTTEKMQYIFTAKNKKIHVSLVLRNQRSTLRPHGTEWEFNGEKTDSFLSIKSKYNFYNSITLNLNFKQQEYKSEEIFYCYSCGDSLENSGIIKPIQMYFDTARKIFYTEKKRITATCTFATKKKNVGIKRRLVNEEIFFLKYHATIMAYYKGNWYYYFKNIFINVKFTIYHCPIGC